ESSIELTPTAQNLVDEIWNAEGRSEETDHPIEILELQFAGKSWEDKVADVREELRKMDADMLVLTALDEIAWLFNLRGGDIPNNPVFKSYAIIDQSKIRLFIDKKIGADVDLHLHVNQCEQECVEIHNYKTVMNTLQALSALDTIKKVLLPSKYSYSGGASYAIYSSVQEEKRTFEVSPVLLMKSRKNQVERMGMRNAHVKDAVALIDFLSFLEDEINAGNAWDETSAATRLEEFRSEQENYRSLSFETISAFGSNGAVIHYKPSPQTSKPITKESPYLLDSGGQYKDGTTDVTRTLHYGTPTDFQKEVYTRVLKGAIDVATLVFPKGTKDTRVDVLARRPLSKVGLDYKHGTGSWYRNVSFHPQAPTQ
ncbi:UNVERIFIED_CONTAM: hypothetical protein GTU68_053881, partial [Idotea baltica]|nr:hypothetical protein [Idotea baltica]